MKAFVRSEAYADQVIRYTASDLINTNTSSVDEMDLSVALHDAIMLYAHAAAKVLNHRGSIRDGTLRASLVSSSDGFIWTTSRTLIMPSKFASPWCSPRLLYVEFIGQMACWSPTLSVAEA